MQMVIVQMIGSLLLTGQEWTEFLSPGFVVVQPQLLWTFGKQTIESEISVSVSPSPFQKIPQQCTNGFKSSFPAKQSPNQLTADEFARYLKNKQCNF